MSAWVESLGNRPAAALLLPIKSISSLLAEHSELVSKIRIAGRLLAYEPVSGYLLVSSHDSSTALWIDPSVAFDGKGDESPLGILQTTEGARSPWMITGELTPHIKLPRTPHSISRTIRKTLDVLPVLLSALLVVHTPTLELGVWEDATRERMESGLEGREKKRKALEAEQKRDDEQSWMAKEMRRRKALAL